MAKKNWIAGALGKPGQLHEDLGVPIGQKIPRALLEQAAKRKDVVGRRARLALTLEGFHRGGKRRVRSKGKSKVRRRVATRQPEEGFDAYPSGGR